MRLQFGEEHSGEEPRYDAATLRKVASLAARLQSNVQERLTAREMEAIGSEVGLEPTFIREALARLSRPRQSAVPRPLGAYAAAWWAAGWTVPLVLAGAVKNTAGGLLFFLFLGVYLAGGILLSQAARRAKGVPASGVSREAVMEMLSTLQQGWEERDERRAFLSVEVVGGGDRVADQLERRLADVVEGCGGKLQSSGDAGAIYVFRTDAEAVHAARRLQAKLLDFNQERGRPLSPLQLRCGVSAGDVVIDENTPSGCRHSHVSEHASELQQRAAPGEILIDGEVSAAALAALDGATLLPEPIAGAPAFSWRAEKDASPPASGE